MGFLGQAVCVYLILIDIVRFLSRKVFAFYDRTVPKSQMSGFVPELLKSYPAERGNHTYKKRTALESFSWWEGVRPFGVCCWEQYH